jgi:hypothetical protein
MTIKTKIRNLEKAYWDNFYANWIINVPSQYGAFVATELQDKNIIIEFGSGNGRDSLYFATLGHIVVAMDISNEAIQKCNESMHAQGIEHAEFIEGDICKLEDVKKTVSIAREYALKEDTSLVFYSRFVMHSLDDEQEKAFLKSLFNEMRPGEKIYFEFRSQEDAALLKHYGNHFRRYVDTNRFITDLTDVYGANIDYQIIGQGMAKYKEEDPFVARIIATKQ